jgi:YggT family protein
MLAVIAHAIFSWLPPEHRRYRIYSFLDSIVAPVLRPIRSVLPRTGGLDFSPFVLILILQLIGRAVLSRLPG